MQNILTLITDPHNAVLTNRQASAVRDALALARGKVGPADWLDPGVACDIPFEGVEPAEAEKVARAALRGAPIDVLVISPENRRKKALIADMESTIIRNEMLDEIAFEADIGPQVADITRRAMNGEIDFRGALRERVGLLKGQPASLLEKAGERIKLMAGWRLSSSGVWRGFRARRDTCPPRTLLRSRSPQSRTAAGRHSSHSAGCSSLRTAVAGETGMTLASAR